MGLRTRRMLRQHALDIDEDCVYQRWITIYLVGREGLPEYRLDDAMVLRLLYLYTFIKAGIK